MKVRLILTGFLILCATETPAATVTNSIVGVGPQAGLVNPYFCIQDGNGKFVYALPPGAAVDGNKYSGNAYYVGGSVRFGGCDASNSYLGYVGFNVSDQHNNKFSSYTPPAGVHITYASPSIDSSGRITGSIQYTPINSNFDLLPSGPSQNSTWDFVGINLSGLEFGKIIDPTVVPNLSPDDASGTSSDLADTQAFLKAGMNTVRVPVSWDYLQWDGPGKGNLNLSYFNSYVRPLLESLTSAKVYTIIDLHAYMRYSQFGQQFSGCGDSGPCPDGKLVVDPQAYLDIWGKLWSYIKPNTKINPEYLMFDLVNEPVQVPNNYVFTIQTQLINSLRKLGFNGYILVEGNAWSGMHSWLDASWKSTDGKTTYTNGTLFTRDNFVKAGVTDLSKILINVHQYLDSNYSGTQDQCLTDLTTTGDGGFNLQAFADYLQQNRLKAIVTEFGAGRDSATCSVALTKFLDYMKTNSAKNKDYGFVGWTIWSTGHGWGDNYKLRVTPGSYQMQTLQGYLQ